MHPEICARKFCRHKLQWKGIQTLHKINYHGFATILEDALCNILATESVKTPMCPNWKIYPTYINLPVLSIICFQLAFLPVELSLYHKIVKLSISTEDISWFHIYGRLTQGWRVTGGKGGDRADGADGSDRGDGEDGRRMRKRRRKSCRRADEHRR